MTQTKRRPAVSGAAPLVGRAARTSVATRGDTSHSERDELLVSALDYAGAGMRVFLLGRSKRPVANCAACRAAGAEHDREACGCLMCHGLYAATVAPGRIRAMRAAAPAGLLAVRTGAVSGIVVIDVDPEHGGQLDPVLMPPTALVRTGSGGWHAYYRHPGVPVLNSQSRLGPGIDVRGDGGYVVAPPSIHPRTRQPYRWVGGHPVVEMPRALADACCAPPAAAAPSSTRPTSTTPVDGIRAPGALLAAHLDAVRRAPTGRRRATLYGSARGVARMVAAGALSTADAWAALSDAGRGAGQTEREVRAAILGGFRDEGVPT